MFFSRFLQSFATIAICAFFLLFEGWKESSKKYFTTLIGISFFGIFITYLLSYFNSENHPVYWNVLKNKIPFLLIPLSLLRVERVEKNYLKICIYVFVVCCLISSIWSYVQYVQNIELYTKLYSQGEVIPTLIHHVSFAVLLCLAVLFTLNNLLPVSTVLEKIINIILLLWFVYFIHILSVRTGILLLYITILLFAVITLITQKKFVLIIALLVLLILSAYLSYEKIPTIKSKLAYTFYGISQLKNNSDTSNLVSDSRRLLSDKIGVEILKKNKLLGVGVGDLQNEMDSVYKERYPSFKPDVYSHIHNQYLYTLCGVGLILGSIFCFCLLLPLMHFIKQQNFVFSIAYLMLLLVMIWEPFIENQLGTSIFLVVCSLGFVSKKEV